MNKQELIDKAVEHFKGKLPDCSGTSLNTLRYEPNLHAIVHYPYLIHYNKYADSHICTFEEFKQRAKELGFVGETGYRYGVEYQTNGKKPYLPDDVEFEYFNAHEAKWKKNKPETGWNKFAFNIVTKFRITDERYKPVDQLAKYGQEICGKIEEKLTAVDDSLNWWDYENNKSAYKGALPPVGTECEYTLSGNLWFKCYVIAHYKLVLKCPHLAGDNDSGMQIIDPSQVLFRPLDHATRAEELERKRVVSTVMNSIGSEGTAAWITLELAYNKGFIKLPENYNE